MIPKCRLCSTTSTTMVLDLGFTPRADGFLSKEKLQEPETYYPLQLVRCDHCFHLQLSYVVPATVLYDSEYPYESSITMTGRNHFDAFAKSLVEEEGLSEDDLVIDIGSNVGVLLNGFSQRGCRVLGFEPVKKLSDIANRDGILTVNHFFSSATARDVAETYGNARVITATNVFAHIDDLDDAIRGVDLLLAENGIFVVEAPDLTHLLSRLEYDTIYHEHLSYFSLTPLVPFFRKNGFSIFNVQKMDIHGGSNRMYICRKGARPTEKIVSSLLKDEDDRKIHSLQYLAEFSAKVEDHRRKLLVLLSSLIGRGYRLAGVSAPAKGMTLLNYCGIGTAYLDFITEKSGLKIGTHTPGGHIPIVSDDDLLSKDIDYALVLAWNFKEEIMNNLVEFQRRGGRFIVPIPEPHVVEGLSNEKN
jgi:hypothetical protein